MAITGLNAVKFKFTIFTFKKQTTKPKQKKIK